jgi:hypothetical protein
LLTAVACFWAQAEQRVTLAWDAPALETNIGGYYLYYGAESGRYTNVINLRPNPTRTTVAGLEDNVTYFFAVTTYRSGLESEPSNETNFTAPTILALDDQFTLENTSISVPIAIGDRETPALLLTVTGTSSDQNLVPNGNLLFDGWGTNRMLTIVPSANQSGTTTITLTLSDGAATTRTSFLLTVDPVNNPPTLDPLDDVALLAVAGLRRVPLTGITSGGSNEVQELTVTAMVDSGSISTPIVEYDSPSGEGSISFGPLSSATGRATITVTVKADGGQTAADIFSRSFSVYVRSPANAPPTISPIADQATDEDTPTSAIAFTIGDNTTPANLLTLQKRSSNTNLVPEANIVFGGNGSSRTVKIVPARNQSGSSKITILAIDAQFGVAATSFHLTVRPVDDAPVISEIPDQIISEDSETVGPIPFHVDDVETAGHVGISKVVVTTLMMDGCSTNALFPAANIAYGGSGHDWALTFRPAADEAGTARISMIATNAKGGTSSNSFLVHVIPINDLPTLDPLPNIVIGDDVDRGLMPIFGVSAGSLSECQTLTVTAVSSDPSLIPDPDVDYTSPNSTGLLFLRPQRGRYGAATITVSVNDGGISNNLVTRRFTAEVIHVNRLPNISPILDQVLTEDGSTGIIPFTISDEETPVEALTVYSLSSNPELIDSDGILLGGSGANRTVILRPAQDQSGIATVALVVLDADGGGSSTSFILSVNAVNDPPSLDAIDDITVGEGDGPKTLSLTGIGPGGIGESQSLAISASADSSSLVAEITVSYTSPDSTATLVITPAAGVTGSTRVTVTVEDDGGTLNGGWDRSTRSFSFTILPHPKLKIERVIGGVVISWPSSAVGFHLVATDNLSSGTWNVVPTVPIVSEDRSRVMLNVAAALRYFRLQKSFAAPALSIRPSGDKIVLSWPGSLTGYGVETSQDLLSPAWELLMVSPVLVSDQNTVILDIAKGPRFFRLRTTDVP